MASGATSHFAFAISDSDLVGAPTMHQGRCCRLLRRSVLLQPSTTGNLHMRTFCQLVPEAHHHCNQNHVPSPNRICGNTLS